MEEGFFWFPFHGGDFLMKTATMRNEEVGCYILLKCHLTRHARLPTKMGELRQLCRGEKTATIKKALLAFEHDSGGYFCKELEAYKQKAAIKAMQKKAAGKAGARARWSRKGQSELEV